MKYGNLASLFSDHTIITDKQQASSLLDSVISKQLLLHKLTGVSVGEVKAVIQELINTQGIYLTLEIIEDVSNFASRGIDSDKLRRILEFLVSERVMATNGNGYGLVVGMRHWYSNYLMMKES